MPARAVSLRPVSLLLAWVAALLGIRFICANAAGIASAALRIVDGASDLAIGVPVSRIVHSTLLLLVQFLVLLAAIQIALGKRAKVWQPGVALLWRAVRAAVRLAIEALLGLIRIVHGRPEQSGGKRG